MVGVEIGMVGVEIGNPWVLDYGFGWRWRWRWLGLVGDDWVFLGFSGGGLWPWRLMWVLDLCLQVWL